MKAEGSEKEPHGHQERTLQAQRRASAQGPLCLRTNMEASAAGVVRVRVGHGGTSQWGGQTK